MNPLLSRRALLGALGAAAVLGPQPAAGQTFPAVRVPTQAGELRRWVAALRVSLHPANDAIDVDRCIAAIRRRT
jgi:selenocysteine lyase/cysteine desulfurase